MAYVLCRERTPEKASGSDMSIFQKRKFPFLLSLERGGYGITPFLFLGSRKIWAICRLF
jgi:hypothetical protein